jgi:hypothetical protein
MKQAYYCFLDRIDLCFYYESIRLFVFLIEISELFFTRGDQFPGICSFRDSEVFCSRTIQNALVTLRCYVAEPYRMH